MGPKPDRAEHRVVEGDEGFLDALGLGLVQPLLHLLHLLRIFRPVAIPQRGRPVVVLAAPQKDEADAFEVEFVDEILRRDAELLQIRHGVQHALDLGIAPHLVIAHAHEPAAVQPGRAHLVIRRRQLLQHGVVHALPVRAVVDRAALISPPDNVAAVDHELGAPGLDVLHDLARHPIAALEPEHRPVHTGKQFHVLDGGLGDPAFVHRQRHDFGLGHERHDDLDELLGDRIEDHLHILLHHLFRDLLRHDQAEHLDEQLVKVRLGRRWAADTSSAASRRRRQTKMRSRQPGAALVC